jgi:hypothetical protein
MWINHRSYMTVMIRAQYGGILVNMYNFYPKIYRTYIPYRKYIIGFLFVSHAFIVNLAIYKIILCLEYYQIT